MQEVTRWTTKKGVSRGGRQFDKNALSQLLTNVVYIGKVKYKDEVHDGEHQAIIDTDMFSQVQRLLQRNGRSGGREVRNKHGALLRGSAQPTSMTSNVPARPRTRRLEDRPIGCN